MKLGRYIIKASRWPWQGWGWFPHKNGKGQKALLNASGSRFGAGWNYRLGISIGGSTVMIDLLFGTVSITKDYK